MRETRVLVLRHGETSAPERFHGAESDIELSPTGRLQAEAAARWLVDRGPTAIYTSTMRRARETAEPIARTCGLMAEVVESIHEAGMGRLAGQLREVNLAGYLETLSRWSRGELDYAPLEGESYSEVRDRVIPAFQDLVDRHPSETIVVVAHGQVIRILITSLIAGFGPADLGTIPINHVAVNDLAYDGRTWRVVALDQIPDDGKIDLSM